MNKIVALLLICSVHSLLPHHAEGREPTTADSIRAIVQKSIGYIDRGGTKWRKEKQCMSCHRGAFTVWALNRAVESGISFDTNDLEDWNNWAADWNSLLANDKREGADQEEVLLRENDAIAQLLMARSDYSDAKTLDSFKEHLVKSQAEDGSWKAGGQLPSQKRPKSETQQVTTMWSVIALADYTSPDDAETEAAFAKAMSWIGDTKTAASTEWWAVRLLAEQNRDKNKVKETREKLLALQHEDGGWGWLHEDPSDALGTGIALYALAKSGAKMTEPFVARAIEFLESTQNKNGGWNVNGTKSNRATKVTETASYWGVCWTVIGLLEFVNSADH